MKKIHLLIAAISLVGCVSGVKAPPDLEIRTKNLPAVPSAQFSTEGDLAPSLKAPAAEVGLSTAARNYRQFQRAKIAAESAPTPEARAAALTEVLETEEKFKDNEKKLDQLLGVGFGMGATITYNLSGDRVESAVVVGSDKIVRVSKEKNVVPRMLLESHYLFTTNPFARVQSSGDVKFGPGAAQRVLCKYNEGDCPTIGVGPFIGFQQNGDGSAFDALALGLAFGFRPTSAAGVAIGAGVMFDSSVQVLGEGIEPGKPLPPGESEIRYKETSQVNPILSVSFTF